MIIRDGKGRGVLILLGLATASLAGLLLLPPIPQDQSYHKFADQRALFGVPNFWNVVSNFPFIAIGIVGLRQFHRNPVTFLLLDSVDRLRFVLLSPRSKRPNIVLGPTADISRLHGDSCLFDRGTRGRKSRSYSIVAACGCRRIQSIAVAMDR